jgi:hypothetical protein
VFFNWHRPRGIAIEALNTCRELGGSIARSRPPKSEPAERSDEEAAGSPASRALDTPGGAGPAALLLMRRCKLFANLSNLLAESREPRLGVREFVLARHELIIEPLKVPSVASSLSLAVPDSSLRLF